MWSFRNKLLSFLSQQLTGHVMYKYKYRDGYLFSHLETYSAQRWNAHLSSVVDCFFPILQFHQEGSAKLVSEQMN